MALRTPPPEIPVISWLSPNKLDQGALEFWNTELASYVPLDVGAPHPNSREFPNFRLGKQSPVQGDEKWVLRIWVTDETSPDWFNWAVKFAGEDNAYPIFIRTYREPRESYAPRTKATPLNALYKMVLTENGTGYANGAYPSITFEESSTPPTTVAIAHGVVAPDGSISECVLDFGGEGYEDDVAFTVASPISGTPASGIAYRQPVSAILINEQASLYPEDSPFYAQYLQVTRVYETLPGPTFFASKFDVDGGIQSIATTRKLCSEIITEEHITDGIWCQTTTKPTDSDIVCEETVVCRQIPGIPIDSTRIDQDGTVITRVQTMVDESTVLSEETIETGIWNKKSKEDIADTSLIAWQVVEARSIPGNPMPTTRLDDDGVEVSVLKTFKDETTVTTQETLITGVWTKTNKENCSSSMGTSDLVVNEVVESRAVPGNPMVSIKIDKDGKSLDEVRTLKDTTTINDHEEITGGGVWLRVGKEAVSDLVAWEVVTARDAQGNVVPSAKIDGDMEVQNIESTLRDESDITPSSTESGGFITTFEKNEVSDLVSEQVRTVTKWLDKALYSQRIPDSIIPIEFRAQIPTVVESHILAGIASMPALAGSEFFVAEQQLTKLLYERRTESLGDIEFPIEQHGQENSTEYGGAILDVHRTLDDSALTADEGEDVVASYVNPIGDALMWFRETKKRPSGDAAWPILESRLWDENYRVEYDETRQVVVAGTSEDPDPGGVFAWVSEVKGLDKWRSLIVNTSKPEPDYVDEASALISYEFKPFKFPGLLTPTGYGYYVRSTYAELTLHTLRTWWVKSATTPTVSVPGGGGDVEIEEIIPENVVISTLNDVTVLAYSGMVLHDHIFTFITLEWLATTPDYTTYLASWQGVEKVIAGTITPEKEKDVWKIVTESVIMR